MNTRSFPAFTLFGVALACIASTPEWASVFEWQRGLVGREPWRLLTAHFSHWSPAHLHWDLLVFAIFGALLELRSRRSFFGVVGLSAFGLGVALPLIHPEMEAYRGLSGIDCALAAAVGALHLRQRAIGDFLIGAAILLFVSVKVVLEFGAAGPFFVDPGAGGFVSLPAAHGLGALIGLLGITMAAVMRQNSAAPRVV